MNQLVSFDHELVRMKGEYRQVLPAHMDADRLGRMVRNAIQKATRKNGDNPLLDADRNSLWSAIMTAASLGLECDGVIGQGYLIPFAGKVQFVPGYAGYITLAWNSGIVLQGVIVHENDTFAYQRGTDARINHVPAQNGMKPGAVQAVYAVADFGQGQRIFDVCTAKDIRDIRDKSSGYRNAVKYGKTDNPWQTHFDHMAKKCPIRIMGKNLPLNVQRAAVMEDLHERGGQAYIRPDGEIEASEPIELEAVE